MKITKRQLRRIIKEEKHKLLEAPYPSPDGNLTRQAPGGLAWIDLENELYELEASLGEIIEKYVTSGWVAENQLGEIRVDKSLDDLEASLHEVSAEVEDAAMASEESRGKQHRR
jgi:hypothetical protein